MVVSKYRRERSRGKEVKFSNEDHAHSVRHCDARARLPLERLMMVLSGMIAVPMVFESLIFFGFFYTANFIVADAAT